MRAIITEKDIRMFLFDKPETNTLVDQVRFSSEDIEQAMINVVDRFNILTPPAATYSVETFPSRSLLCLGVAGWLMRGAALGEASNQLEYSAAGVQVNDRNKAEIFTTLGNALWQEFIDASKEWKLTQSINEVYSQTWSEYSWIYH